MTASAVPCTAATEVDPIAARLAPIRCALTSDASADVRRAALAPLRAIYAEILASLDLGAAPAPASVHAVPAVVAPSSQPLRGMPIDQVLDLVIAQLRAVAGDGAAGDATGGPLAQLLAGGR